MSAIAGIINFSADAAIVEGLLKTMRHRGPDGEGTYIHEGFTLLHTRHSLDSLTSESQPIIFDRGNQRYCISFDGALYNADELRRQLQTLGHNFVGKSDGEVMVRAYAQWKDEALLKCNGVFAFAIWEEHSRSLFLARDRIGVKPLFYMACDNGLLFASEMKTILSHPDVEAKLDAEGANQILLLGPGRKPGSGVFRDMMELEPGCCATYHQGHMQVSRYWKLTDRVHRDSFPETVEKVKWLIKDSIRRQTKPDTTIGSFLSGGLDSSLVSALTAREMDQKGKKIHTFSLDYLDHEKYFQPGKFQPNADAEFIRIMQSELDSVHHWTVLNPEDLANGLSEATIARDLPGMADVDSSLLAFCKNVRPYVNIALSGECADEIFGGYPWFRDPKVRNADGFPWAQTTRERAAFQQSWLQEAMAPEAYITDLYRQTLRDCDILPETNESEKRMKEMVNLNFRWFMQTLLDRNDRMSMACGLEVRVPLCDYRIAEYLYGIPWTMKDYKGNEKGLLRQSMMDVLPQCIAQRKKSPFPKTYDPQYLQIVSDLLRDLLTQNDAPIFGLVRREALQDLLTQEFPWPWYGQLMQRAQTIGFMLQVDFWLRHYSVKLV